MKCNFTPERLPSVHVLTLSVERLIRKPDNAARHRPTPVYRIVPHVIDALERAGIEDNQIRFIAALGAHGAHTASDLRKKLGDEVLERFPIYNHNPFGSCTYLGKTGQGTPVSINSEVMACDLKIGIGCITPHAFSGFGGGGKIIFPGVAHMDTISYNHGPLLKANPECIGFGRIEGNAVRLDIEEAARMAGLDVKVDAVLNLRGEITGLFVGDPILEHNEGMKLAKEVFATAPMTGMDVVVVNAFAKSNECVVVPFIALPSIKEEGGDLVSKNGVTVGPQPVLSKVRRCIFLSPIKDIAGASVR